MALSNTAVPKYYGRFRDAVIAGQIPINQEVELQRNRIDALIDNPMYYYDDIGVKPDLYDPIEDKVKAYLHGEDVVFDEV